MKDNALIKSKQEILAFINEKIQTGSSAYIDAGKAVLSAVEQYGIRFIDEIINYGIPSDIVKMLYQIGRNPDCAQLILLPHRAAKRLLQCDEVDRIKYQTEPIPVIDPNNLTEHRLIGFKELTQNQCMQVFNSHHVRTLAEQRTWIEENKKDASVKPINQPYEIRRGKLIVLQPTEFSREELFVFLAKMEAK